MVTVTPLSARLMLCWLRQLLPGPSLHLTLTVLGYHCFRLASRDKQQGRGDGAGPVPDAASVAISVGGRGFFASVHAHATPTQ